jgi:hypothetical protein
LFLTALIVEQLFEHILSCTVDFPEETDYISPAARTVILSMLAPAPHRLSPQELLNLPWYGGGWVGG